MKQNSLIALLSALFALAAAPSHAAQPADRVPADVSVQDTGTITGRVQNVFLNVYLEGARVELAGTGRVDYTDQEGRYTFGDVPAGEAVIHVSYTGLNPQRAAVAVIPGRAVTRDVDLTSEVYLMEKFVVANVREGQAAAITLQRNAPNVKNIAATDAFGNIADGNAAEFVKRLSGVSAHIGQNEARYVMVRGIDSNLNGVTVDGIKIPSASSNNRQTLMNEIPIGAFDLIEVTKSPTPDMDGDSIGGNINMKPKSILDRATPRLLTYSVSASTRLDSSRNKVTPSWSFGYQDVFGSKRNLGLTLNLSSSVNFAPQEYVLQSWQQTLSSPAYLTSSRSTDAIIGKERRRDGAHLRADYRLSEASRLHVGLFYSSLKDKQAHFGGNHIISGLNQVATLDAAGVPIPFQPQFPFGHPSYTPGGFNASGARVAASILPGYTDRVTRIVNGTLQISNSRNTYVSTRYSIQPGGRHVFGDFELDYTATYSESPHVAGEPSARKDLIRGYRIDVPRTEWLLDGTNSIILREITQTGGVDIRDPNNWVVAPFTTNVARRRTDIYGGQINLKRRFLSPVPHYFKTGAKFMTEDRYRAEHSDQYNYVGPRSALANALETSFSYDAAGRHYPIFYLDTSKVDALRASNPAYFTNDPQLKLRNDLLNDQEAQERVLAGYLMGGADLGRLSMLAGLRVEKTYVSGTSAVQDPQAAVGILDPTARTLAQYGRRVTIKKDYTNVLPGIHFKGQLGQDWLMRASYSASFGRPSFGSIYPATNINYTTERITQNNPALKPQKADNFDVTIERYFEPVGLISAGVFLKEISNFIYSSVFPIAPGNDNGFGGEYAGWTLATQANGGFGRVRGIELNYSQQLSFLPGLLRGFGIFANYTYLETIGNYGRLSGGATGDLAQFTPRVLNGGLSYARNKFSGRIYANCIGRYLEGWNANPLLLEYTMTRTIADLNLSYGLSKALTVFVDVNNIFNSKFRRVAGPFDHRLQTRESNATRITAGISGRY